MKDVKKMHTYKLIENGFCISLDLSLYARPAVMKALYKYHQKYLISFEAKKDRLYVYFESSTPLSSVDREVASILKEFNYQMIRYDTMQATNQIRQLLVARALYATCVEDERTLGNR
jgi:His-Xaa-Ser system protein HxsD